MPHTRIVITEDQIMVRDMLCDLIAAISDMQVVGVAGSVQESLIVCLDHRPDMAIIDWMLPDGTGLELVRRLREMIPDIRILMLTASEQAGIVKDAASVGVQGFVSKKQPISVLRNAILALADGKHFYCPTSYRVLVNALRDPECPTQSRLSDRDWSLLRAIANGMSTKQMAEQFDLSQKTVCNQISLLKEKLGISETAGLVLFALRHGLVNIQ